MQIHYFCGLSYILCRINKQQNWSKLDSGGYDLRKSAYFILIKPINTALTTKYWNWLNATQCSLTADTSAEECGNCVAHCVCSGESFQLLQNHLPESDCYTSTSWAAFLKASCPLHGTVKVVNSVLQLNIIVHLARMFKKFNVEKVKLNYDSNNRFVGLEIFNRKVSFVSSTWNILCCLCEHFTVLPIIGRLVLWNWLLWSLYKELS